MKLCLLLCDNEDCAELGDIENKMAHALEPFGYQVKSEADIEIGSVIAEEKSKMIKDADVILYLFSSSANTEKIKELAKTKRVICIHLQYVPTYLFAYIVKHKVKIVPRKPIADIGINKGISIVCQAILGNKDKQRLRRAVFSWILPIAPTH